MTRHQPPNFAQSAQSPADMMRDGKRAYENPYQQPYAPLQASHSMAATAGPIFGIVQPAGTTGQSGQQVSPSHSDVYWGSKIPPRPPQPAEPPTVQAYYTAAHTLSTAQNYNTAPQPPPSHMYQYIQPQFSDPLATLAPPHPTCRLIDPSNPHAGAIYTPQPNTTQFGPHVPSGQPPIAIGVDAYYFQGIWGNVERGADGLIYVGGYLQVPPWPMWEPPNRTGRKKSK
jgi:hypothetical protein